ncbi:hypothetical protein GCM10023189_31970 [Nibrella saemangeumensis]|uniref:Outer membrane protein beta-barrel domain-containing protein n=1 Tax=Nibrella saemangeumensis TaxID=1084526 RepID=A0ABP8MZY5_9BACT
MKQVLMKKLYLLLFMSTTLFTLWTDCFAQRTQPSYNTKRKEEDVPASVTVRGGATVLFGDLNEQARDWSYGMDIKVPITRVIAGQIIFDRGFMQARESSFYISKAKAQFAQIALAGSIDLLRLFKFEGTHSVLDFTTGVGLIYFHTKAYDILTNKLQRYTSDSTSHHSPDGYKITSPPNIRYTRELVIPIGLSFHKAMSEQISVHGGVRLNLVRTDKLDATIDNDNSTYIDPLGKRTPNNGGWIYGNKYETNTNDNWLLISAGLTYFFR